MCFYGTCCVFIGHFTWLTDDYEKAIILDLYDKDINWQAYQIYNRWGTCMNYIGGAGTMCCTDICRLNKLFLHVLVAKDQLSNGVVIYRL